MKTNLKEDLRSKNILENDVEAQKLKHSEIEETIFLERSQVQNDSENGIK